MAFGFPIITRSIGGLKDLIKDEINGYTTESKEPRVFAVFLERLIENRNLMKEISLQNYLYARDNFLASTVIQRIEKIYIDLMLNNTNY